MGAKFAGVQKGEWIATIVRTLEAKGQCRMRDDGKKAFTVLILMSCIVVPPALFGLLGLFASVACDRTWKYEGARCVVIASALAISYGTRTVWRTGISDELKRGFVSSYIAHAAVLCFASLLLDGGLTLYACLLASMLYWTMVGFVVARRPLTPTPFDIFLVSRGYLALAFAVSVIFWTTYAARGY